MRLENFIAKNTTYNKKEISKLLAKGLVKINGSIIKKGAAFNDEQNDIKIEINNEVFNVSKDIYIILNKPKNYVCANKDSMHQTVFELLNGKFKVDELFTIGRLDIDTEGLVLITNNGQMSHRLRSPKWKVNKKYYVQLDQELNNDLVDVFAQGILIDKEYKTLPATLKIIDKFSAYLTISEGKFHQVKKMFLALGMKVKFLKRVEFANLKLDEKLKLGDFRHLTNDEIKSLKTLCNLND